MDRWYRICHSSWYRCRLAFATSTLFPMSTTTATLFTIVLENTGNTAVDGNNNDTDIAGDQCTHKLVASWVLVFPILLLLFVLMLMCNTTCITTSMLLLLPSNTYFSLR
ncbi:hypothetical protein EDD16DRAFT_1641477 [Pisolithus croceorrhizus]|nr:hypothetical protein EDD16DRAFT_1641477 [Pisolithus croceorrhizus]